MTSNWYNLVLLWKTLIHISRNQVDTVQNPLISPPNQTQSIQIHKTQHKIELKNRLQKSEKKGHDESSNKIEQN